ncbi:MAG TPA: OsmC family protein [Kofleriaceae bacterium]|jgi:putative redox protein
MDSTRLATAHLTSQPARYAQAIRVGHHEVVADEPVALGGADAGIAPYGLLVASLAACTSITLRMYAERKGWELGEIKVDLEMTRDGEAETIARTITFGAALSDEQRHRLGEIADKTPVTKTLRRAIAITTTVR